MAEDQSGGPEQKGEDRIDNNLRGWTNLNKSSGEEQEELTQKQEDLAYNATRARMDLHRAEGELEKNDEKLEEAKENAQWVNEHASDFYDANKEEIQDRAVHDIEEKRGPGATSFGQSQAEQPAVPEVLSTGDQESAEGFYGTERTLSQYAQPLPEQAAKRYTNRQQAQEHEKEHLPEYIETAKQDAEAAGHEIKLGSEQDVSAETAENERVAQAVSEIADRIMADGESKGGLEGKLMKDGAQKLKDAVGIIQMHSAVLRDGARYQEALDRATEQPKTDQ